MVVIKWKSLIALALSLASVTAQPIVTSSNALAVPAYYHHTLSHTVTNLYRLLHKRTYDEATVNSVIAQMKPIFDKHQAAVKKLGKSDPKIIAQGRREHSQAHRAFTDAYIQHEGILKSAGIDSEPILNEVFTRLNAQHGY